MPAVPPAPVAAALATARAAYLALVRGRRRAKVADAAAFCERLVREGRITRPQARAMALPVLLRADDTRAVHRVAGGRPAVRLTAYEAKKRELGRLPAVTRLAESPRLTGRPGDVAAAAGLVLADAPFFGRFPPAAAAVARAAVRDAAGLTPGALGERIDRMWHALATAPPPAAHRAALDATLDALAEVHARAVGRTARGLPIRVPDAG
jgi:hypothetical protein